MLKTEFALVYNGVKIIMHRGALAALRAAVLVVSLVSGAPNPPGSVPHSGRAGDFDGYYVSSDGVQTVGVHVKQETKPEAINKALPNRTRAAGIVISNVLTNSAVDNAPQFLLDLLKSFKPKPRLIILQEDDMSKVKPFQDLLLENQAYGPRWRFSVTDSKGEEVYATPVFVGSKRSGTLVALHLPGRKIAHMPDMAFSEGVFHSPQPQEFDSWFPPPHQYSSTNFQANVKTADGRVVSDHVFVHEKVVPTAKDPLTKKEACARMSTVLMTTDTFRYVTDNGKKPLQKHNVTFVTKRGSLLAEPHDVIFYDLNLEGDRRQYTSELFGLTGPVLEENVSLYNLVAMQVEIQGVPSTVIYYFSKLRANASTSVAKLRDAFSKLADVIAQARAAMGKSAKVETIALPRVASDLPAKFVQSLFLQYFQDSKMTVEWFEGGLSPIKGDLTSTTVLTTSGQTSSETEPKSVEASSNGTQSSVPLEQRPPSEKKGKGKGKKKKTEAQPEGVEMPSTSANGTQSPTAEIMASEVSQNSPSTSNQSSSKATTTKSKTTVKPPKQKATTEMAAGSTTTKAPVPPKASKAQKQNTTSSPEIITQKSAPAHVTVTIEQSPPNSPKIGNRSVDEIRKNSGSVPLKSLAKFYSSDNSQVGYGVPIYLKGGEYLVAPKHVWSIAQYFSLQDNDKHQITGTQVSSVGHDLVILKLDQDKFKCFRVKLPDFNANFSNRATSMNAGHFVEGKPYLKSVTTKGQSGTPLIQDGYVIGFLIGASGTPGNKGIQFSYFDPSTGAAHSTPEIEALVQLSATQDMEIEAKELLKGAPTSSVLAIKILTFLFNVSVLTGLNGAPGIHGWLYKSGHRFTIQELTPLKAETAPCTSACLRESVQLTHRLLQDYEFVRLHTFDHIPDTEYGCCATFAGTYRQSLWPRGLDANTTLRLLEEVVHVYGSKHWFPDVCQPNKTSGTNAVSVALFGKAGRGIGCIQGRNYTYNGYPIDVPFYLL